MTEEQIQQLKTDNETLKLKCSKIENELGLEKTVSASLNSKLEGIKKLCVAANQKISEYEKDIKELKSTKFPELRVNIFSEYVTLVNSVEFRNTLSSVCMELKKYNKNKLMEILINLSFPQFVTTVNGSYELDNVELSDSFDANEYQLDVYGKEFKYSNVLGALDGTSTKLPKYGGYEDVNLRTILTRDVDEDPRGKSDKPLGKLPTSTPVFKGRTKDSLEDWLYKIEAGFSRFKITSDADKLAELAMYVENEAFEILKNVNKSVDSSTRTMSVFKEKMLARFGDATRDSALMREYRMLKQGDKLDDYIFKFRKLVSLLPHLDTKTIIWDFKEGLKQRSKFEVVKAKPKTLEEAITTAVEFDLVLDDSSHNKGKDISISNVMKSPNRIQRFKGSRGSHIGSNDRNNNRYDNQNQLRMIVKCHNCKQSGHYARNCQMQQRQQQTTNQQSKKFSGHTNKQQQQYRNGTNYQKSNNVPNNTARSMLAMKSSNETANEGNQEKVNFERGANSFNINMVATFATDDEFDIKAEPLLSFQGFLNNLPVLMAVDSGAMTSVLAYKAAMDFKRE